MMIEDLLVKRKMTKYRLAVLSGIPHTTLNDICSGKTKLQKCSAETVYKLAKTLNVSKNKLMNMGCQSICSMIWTPLRKASKIIAACWTVFGVSCTEVSI